MKLTVNLADFNLPPLRRKAFTYFEQARILSSWRSPKEKTELIGAVYTSILEDGWQPIDKIWLRINYDPETGGQSWRLSGHIRLKALQKIHESHPQGSKRCPICQKEILIDIYL